MNHKNRKPKAFKGCCRQCACRDHHGGVRNKRRLTPQELRARYAATEQREMS